MAKYDFRAPRLFVEASLGAGAEVPLGPEAAHYLTHVLRLAPGEAVLAFNGQDGEWRSEILRTGKRNVSLRAVEQIRVQPVTAGPGYAFAPLKQARLDYMIQKAVEMGVSRLMPVATAHTQVTRMNDARLRANAIEAAEQCGILALPDIDAMQPFAPWLAARSADTAIVFCDEESEVASPVAALQRLQAANTILLVGPEGGFDASERRTLLARDNTLRISLGPRILRADTAAVAALTLFQAVCGDWR
jgi:16S rRNA (uracil1498-N3)-methyltransferase